MPFKRIILRVALAFARTWAWLKIGPQTLHDMIEFSRHCKVDAQITGRLKKFRMRPGFYTAFGVRPIRFSELGPGDIHANLARRGLALAPLEAHLAYCADRLRLRSFTSECDVFVTVWELADRTGSFVVRTTDTESEGRWLEVVRPKDGGDYRFEPETWFLTIPA
jgi:hypothetical protein